MALDQYLHAVQSGCQLLNLGTKAGIASDGCTGFSMAKLHHGLQHMLDLPGVRQTPRIHWDMDAAGAVGSESGDDILSGVGHEHEHWTASLKPSTFQAIGKLLDGVIEISVGPS